MDEFKRQFYKTAATTFFISAILGLLAGTLYRAGVIGDRGLWVDALNWIAKFELDKVGFAFLFFGALYVAVWALLGKLAKVYLLSKWFLVKCCLGVSLVPVFAFFAGLLIPPLGSMRALAAFVGMEGFVLAAVWMYLLP